MIESISAHPDFGNSGINMNAQTTGGADDIVSDAPSLPSLGTDTLSISTYSASAQAYIMIIYLNNIWGIMFIKIHLR